MILTSLLIGIPLILLFGLARARWRTRQLSFLTWKQLVEQIQPVKNEGIQTLALDYLEPTHNQTGRNMEEMWDLVGGTKGLKRMKNNADVLIALAEYAEGWNTDESAIVAARMERDGLALRRAVVGLGLGITCGYGNQRVSGYLQEAASSYYLMRKRLLLLYKSSHSGLYPCLGEALQTRLPTTL